MDDISDTLERWPFDTARVQARLLSREGATPVIQLRIDLGILQMERDGRPDGQRPGGFPSILHQYRALADRIEKRGCRRGAFAVPPEDYPELDRELLQYYHRRIALFSLGDYARAARDAQHGLRLIRLIVEHVRDAAFVSRHERMVPFLLLERARALALLALGHKKQELAVRCLEDGIRQMQEHGRSSSAEANTEAAKEISFLKRWARKIRRAHQLGPSLEHLLEDAVRREDYEEAARIRDEIRRKASR